MGRMSNLSSKRERNQRERRRRKRGLIIGSAVVLFALACYVGNAYLHYRNDRASLAPAAVGESSEISAVTEEVSFADYLLPLRAVGAGTETVTITVTATAGGSVTPASVTVEKGGTVTLRATPNAGYETLYWKKNGTSFNHKSNILVLSNVTENATYEAYFSRTAFHVTYEVSPEGGGYILNEQEYLPHSTTGNASVTCEAKPYPGYKFQKWECNTGSPRTSTNAQETFSFNMIDDNAEVHLKAVFVPDTDGKIHVTLHAVPAGSVGITAQNSSCSPNIASTYTLESSSHVHRLDVKVFWETSSHLSFIGMWNAKTGALIGTSRTSGTEGSYSYELFTCAFTGNGLTEDSEFFIAYSSDSSVTTVASPTYAGITSGDMAAGTGSATTTITATPNHGYMFDHWEWYEGGQLKTNKNQNLSVSVTGHRLYTAVFVTDTYEIKGTCVPENGGAITGLGKHEAHQDATVTAVPSTGFQFDKWTYTTTDGVQHESTNPSLTLSDIDQDYHLTAQFSSSNPTLSVSVNPLGSTGDGHNYVRISGEASVSDTGTQGNIMMTVSNGSSVSLEAFPNTGADYEFAYWVDQDGNTSSMNPLAVGNIRSDTSYTAFFTKKESANGVKILASPPSGGKVSAKKQDDGSIIISASANRGYDFLYWKCSDTNTVLTKSTSYTIPETDVVKHYTYIAYFSIDKDEKLTSDLTQEHFPNVRRLFADPNYQYTRPGWTYAVANYINMIRGKYPQASGTPNNYAAYASAEEAAKEKVAEYAPPEITAQGELITTENEVIPVTDAEDPDSMMDRALAITEEKFGERYTPEIICVKDVSAPNGFVDGVRTYLWSGTGVDKDDNLFIIYKMNGEERIVTPIADFKGNLRFTIDKLGAVNKFTLVRVTVE